MMSVSQRGKLPLTALRQSESPFLLLKLLFVYTEKVSDCGAFRCQYDFL